MNPACPALPNRERRPGDSHVSVSCRESRQVSTRSPLSALISMCTERNPGHAVQIKVRFVLLVYCWYIAGILLVYCWYIYAYSFSATNSLKVALSFFILMHICRSFKINDMSWLYCNHYLNFIAAYFCCKTLCTYLFIPNTFGVSLLCRLKGAVECADRSHMLPLALIFVVPSTHTHAERGVLKISFSTNSSGSCGLTPFSPPRPTWQPSEAFWFGL